jgi:predicted nucleic acid-binding protein
MLNKPVLIDSGPLAALFNPNDQYHEICKEAAQQLPVGKSFTCWPVVTEASHFLRRFPDKRNSLLDAIQAGEFQLLPLDSGDIPALQNIPSTYRDQAVDLADASLLHLANREEIENVFTVDRRHFGVFRQQNGKSLRMMPDI